MTIPPATIKKIERLKRQYNALKHGRTALLNLIDEAEIPENVYNSNAIENSTLTLSETEQILLEQQVARTISTRELYEAQNLARVIAYKRTKVEQNQTLTTELLLLLHQMLIGVINDPIAGRFRQTGEYVRVGTHIAPPPEHIIPMLQDALAQYHTDTQTHTLQRIARFHLAFEHIHPFNDGNGRIGRVTINFQLLTHGYPRIIIRNKEKQQYYAACRQYHTSQNTATMENILTIALMEALHKRITYLNATNIITLAQHARANQISPQSITAAARRQTIPAFREKGIWKIAQNYDYYANGSAARKPTTNNP